MAKKLFRFTAFLAVFVLGVLAGVVTLASVSAGGALQAEVSVIETGPEPQLAVTVFTGLERQPVAMGVISACLDDQWGPVVATSGVTKPFEWERKIEVLSNGRSRPIWVRSEFAREKTFLVLWGSLDGPTGTFFRDQQVTTRGATYRCVSDWVRREEGGPTPIPSTPVPVATPTATPFPTPVPPPPPPPTPTPSLDNLPYMAHVMMRYCEGCSVWNFRWLYESNGQLSPDGARFERRDSGCPVNFRNIPSEIQFDGDGFSEAGFSRTFVGQGGDIPRACGVSFRNTRPDIIRP